MASVNNYPNDGEFPRSRVPGPRRLRKLWQRMIDRCTNPKVERYPHYGGRGISICNDWLDFGKFKAWAFENGYLQNLSIDRINNDGNYEPGNCRWIPLSQQQNNTSRSAYIEAFGETKTLLDWSRDHRCVVSYSALQLRIRKCKWPAEKAISTLSLQSPSRHSPYRLKMLRLRAKAIGSTQDQETSIAEANGTGPQLTSPVAVGNTPSSTR